MKTGIELIADERERQINEEGWNIEHDKIANNDGQLVSAAILYAIEDDNRMYEHSPENVWPWDMTWWKPTPNNRVRELVKAGALIAAEIDRINNTECVFCGSVGDTCVCGNSFTSGNI